MATSTTPLSNADQLLSLANSPFGAALGYTPQTAQELANTGTVVMPKQSTAPAVTIPAPTPTPIATPTPSPAPAPTPTAASTPSPTASSGNNNAYIIGLYQNYLGRAPTTSELQYYNNALSNGTTTNQLPTYFQNSAEYKADQASGNINAQGAYTATQTPSSTTTAAPTPAPSPVATPAPTPTTANTTAGTTNTGTTPASTNNNAAIANLYQTYLGRQPSASELAFYNNALSSGTTLAQLPTYFQNSTEYKGDISSGDISSSTGQYQQPVTQSNIATTVGNGVNNPTLPTGTQVNPVLQTSNANENISNPTVAVGGNAATAQNANMSTATNTAATAATATNSANSTAATDTTNNSATQNAALQSGQYQASTIGNNVPQVTAAQGTVDPNSTVAGQYNNLTAGVDNGAVPDWAKSAVAATNAQMASRGLGASTMAASANTAAILQAALPIAQQDAQTNAQMQFQNLSNEQQAAITNTNNQFQAMLSDQAVTNAAAQFNASSQSQIDEYFANLKTQQSQYNASQVNAMAQFNASQANTTSQFNTAQTNTTSQFNSTQANATSQFNAYQENAGNEFNAGQANAMSQFNSNLASQQAQFNASNQLVVDQSNATWQRQINTANTATENAANQINAQDLLNISNTDLNNLWQQYRDNASYAFQASQNSSNQAANIALAALNNTANSNLLDQASLNQMASSVGSLALNVLGKYLGS